MHPRRRCRPILTARRAARRVCWAGRPISFFLLALASVFCCMPMAIPQAHLPALCSDLGIPASHGAAMLSVLLGAAFVSRQLWGWISDRFGGLNTVLAGSAFQIVTIIGFIFTQDEIGLFTVAAASGSGLCRHRSSLHPRSSRAFPAGDAYWRIPDIALVQRQRHGRRRLACRRALRPFRLLCACFRRAALPPMPQTFSLLRHPGAAAAKGFSALRHFLTGAAPALQSCPDAVVL